MAEGGNNEVPQGVPQDPVVEGDVGGELVAFNQFLERQQTLHRRRWPSPTPAEVLGPELLRELEWQEEYRLYGEFMRTALFGLEANNAVRGQTAHALPETLSRARELAYRDAELEADMFRLVRDPNQHLPIRTNDTTHAYSTIYRATFAYQEVLVKECANFTFSREMLDREVAMTARFHQVTVPIVSLKLTESNNLFRLGVRYFGSSLDTLMRRKHACEVIWNITEELFRVMSYFENDDHLLRDFRLNSFRIVEVDKVSLSNSRIASRANEKTFKIYVSSPHEAVHEDEINHLEHHMHQEALSTFPMPNGETQHWDRYSERYAIGQIIARFALGMSTLDPLNGPTERDALLNANLLSNRANTFRLIAMRLMAPDRASRPSFSQCRHDISTWKIEKFHQFMIRFFDFYNSNQTRLAEAIGEITLFSDEMLRGEANWLNPQFLSHEAYRYLIKGGRKQELRKPANANYRLQGDYVRDITTGVVVRAEVFIPDQDVAATLSCNGAAHSVFRVYRNKAAHFFEFCREIGVAYGLSEDYFSFWCGRFPMMGLIAWIVAARTRINENDSFAEFFSCAENNFYHALGGLDCLCLPLRRLHN